MSATRLLVLGVVRGYGRVHGYRVGADLASWGADEWANVKWGSIYHALRSLAEAGFLNDIDDIPGRTDYELTERGEGEFSRLLRDAIRRPRARPDLFGAALALLPAVPRDVAINLLRERLSSLEQAQEKARIQQVDWAGPPHVIELFGLWEHNSARDAQWTRNLITHLETGKYAMLGDPNSPGRPGSWWAVTHLDD